MSPPPSTPPHTCWAFADDWKSGHVILGSNVHSIPAPPSHSQPTIGSDGFWGVHEWTQYPQPYCPKFPYLAWIPQNPSNPTSSSFGVYNLTLQKPLIWTAHPDKSSVHLTNEAVLKALREEWSRLKAEVEASQDGLSQRLPAVQYPQEAYFRAMTALDYLGDDLRGWNDVLLVFRSLQRSLLELQAFVHWWEDVCAGSTFKSPIRQPTRGSIFEDVQAYVNHHHWSIATYLLVPRSSYQLDPKKVVSLSPRTLCKTQPMFHNPITLHNLPHIYYPPLVNNFISEFETAARGYAARLDAHNPSLARKRKLDKLENQMKDKGK